MGNAGGDPRRKMAETNTILRATVGSTLFGLNLDNSGDTDEMGVCLENLEAAYGFNPFEQYEYRTAAEREGKHDAPSQPGDIDLTIYSLRKYLKLAMDGNPSIIVLLFAPEKSCSRFLGLGDKLQKQRVHILSKECGKRFLGYMTAQRMRLVSPMLQDVPGTDECVPKVGFEWLLDFAFKYGWKLKRKGGKDVNRKELEERYGYDTKYAMHMLRLGFQGVELLSTGNMQLPLPEEPRQFLLAVRRGEIKLSETLDMCGKLEQELGDLTASSTVLPDKPNVALVEDWMINVYWQCWRAQRYNTLITDTVQ